MVSANQRSALASLDVARPVVARLDPSRHPEDVAADLIESWSAVETALRSLVGGSAMGGQPLIAELRGRQLLSLPQAHALLEFLAARDRSSRAEYRPTASDVTAARTGFQAIEEAATLNPDEATLTGEVAPLPGARARAQMRKENDVAPTMDISGAQPLPSRGPVRLIGALVLALLVLGGVAGWYYWDEQRNGPRALRSAIALYGQGDRGGAQRAFEAVARDRPNLATPHVYLARIARESNDLATAQRELQTAVRLAPDNALAQREMGSFLLATNQNELASRFYKRAVELDPTDRVAMGYLGCSLARMGQYEVATRFLTRAGPGDWSACQPQSGAVMGAPGAAAPMPAPPRAP